MGNEYGVSPLTMLQLLSPMIVIVPVVLWLWVIGPLLLYPLARWKANREQVSDPQLGLKVALHYFALLAFQLVLLAVVIILFTLFSKAGASKGSAYRAGFGLLLPAAGVLVAHLALLKRTNEAQFPGVRRLFLGYNLAVTGLVGFVALLFAFQVFFAKGSAGNEGRLAIASVLVYTGAWAACGILFARVVLGDSSGPPSSIVPPSASGPTSPQQSGPVLAPLGAGSFPPIEQK